MTEFLWLFVLVGGPIILGAAIAFGMRQRRLHGSGRNAATRHGYYDGSDM